jgi:hypothetical protein
MGDQSLAWRIRVTFAGKLPPHQYTTPDIRRSDPGWGDEIFNRQIEQLEFFLPSGHKIVLAGMESYNFYVEATQSFSKKGGARIEAFWFLGKPPGSPLIEMWRIGKGKVFHDHKPWGQEWGGTATRGWKSGLIGGELVSELVKVI